MSALILLLACAADEPAPVDAGDPAAPLVLPDVSDLDVEGSFRAALELSLGVQTSAVWSAHVSSLELRRDGCPDLYLGGAEAIDLDADVYWLDECATAGGLFWSGGLGWAADHAADGDPEDDAGETTEASRVLVGDGLVGDGDGARFGFDGEASDAIYRAEAPGYETWTWSSLVEGTLEGRDAAGDDAPEGWRADLYLYATGGESQSLTLRGDAFFFQPVLMDRFDSLSMDLEIPGPGSSAPEDCAAEPEGYLGLRDGDGYWYDLIFQPRYGSDADSDYENEPYSGCEGCGTLYLRGVESGEVCLDLSFLWDGAIVPPDPEDYALSLRDLTGSAR